MSKKQTQVIQTPDEAIPVGIEIPHASFQYSETCGETAAEAALTTNIYNEIRKRLAARGVPIDQVAFIHDAKTPDQRAKLFAAVNDGKIRVLIGSTEKMGTGMNVQERCIALHTITPPWRPADIEQQVGRVIRQGNLFPHAAQFVHVTEGSFDAYVWQLLENKAGFIAQISSGQVTDREVDDVDETVLTFSEIKALASGNPMIMQLIVLQAELSRLHAIRVSWESSRSRVSGSVRTLERQREEALARIEIYKQAIQHRDANTTEKFSVQLKPTIDADIMEVETDREAAGRKIRLLAEQAAKQLLEKRNMQEWREIGAYRGYPINATVSGFEGDEVHLFFKIGNEILNVGFNTDTGVARSMDIRLNSLDTMLEDARDFVQVVEKKIEAVKAETDQVWEHEKKYHELQEKVNELDALLNKDKEKAQSKEVPAHVPTPVFARKTIAAKRDTASEVRSALDAMKAMLSDPAILARFNASQVLTLQSVAAAAPVEIPQALFDFDLGAASVTVLQFDLFGGTVSVSPTRKSRRR